MGSKCIQIAAITAAASLFAARVLADYEGLPLTFLWNPNVNQVIDTSDHK